jgi:hypothetical protein
MVCRPLVKRAYKEDGAGLTVDEAAELAVFCFSDTFEIEGPAIAPHQTDQTDNGFNLLRAVPGLSCVSSPSPYMHCLECAPSSVARTGHMYVSLCHVSCLAQSLFWLVISSPHTAAGML